MGGFTLIDGKYVDAYAVNYIAPNYNKKGCEMMLACGKVVYSGLSASEVVQQLATTRAECEGRT